MKRQFQNKEVVHPQRACGATTVTATIRRWCLAPGIVGLLAMAGCTLEPVDTRYVMAKEERLRPHRIVVYDFAVTTGELPSSAPIDARLAAGRTVPAEQVTQDSKLGARMGAQLMAAIQKMGLPVEHASLGTPLQADQVAVRGCFASAHPDGSGKRLTVGFDFTSSELLALVETIRIARQGTFKRLVCSNNPSGLIISSGVKMDGQTPGRPDLDTWAGEAVKEIAVGLEAIFQEQGWLR